MAEPPSERETGAARRRRRRWPYVTALVLLAASAAGWASWGALRRVHPVSVQSAVSRLRSASPAPTAGTADLARPPSGVYVYDTQGSEHIDVAGLSHTYPAQTTLTVTAEGCGLRLRWAALTERWAEWLLCATPQGWRVHDWTDLHKFLYQQDRQDYACAGEPLVLPVDRGAGPWSAVCQSATDRLAATFTVVGSETVVVAGRPLATTHLHVVTVGTGHATNDGVIDAWLWEPTALPVRVQVRNRGQSTALGQVVHYSEDVRLDLASTTPRT